MAGKNHLRGPLAALGGGLGVVVLSAAVWAVGIVAPASADDSACAAATNAFTDGPDTIVGTIYADVLRGGDIAALEMPEVELDRRIEAPLQRHLVDRYCPLAPIHGRREMPGRVQVRAVVG